MLEKGKISPRQAASIGFGFMKITVCLYAFVLGLAQWLNLKDYKPIAMPAGLLMLALSTYVYENYTDFRVDQPKRSKTIQ